MTARRYDLLQAASDDILDLLAYVASYSDEASDRFVDALTDVFEKLAELPGMGRDRSYLVPGLRSFSVNALRVTVFYRETARASDRIEIARVLRQEREVTAAAFE